MGSQPASATDALTPQAFEAWVAPHWAAMARIAHRLVGASAWEDVLQDALANAWRKWRQFDPARGSARNWLLAITADQAVKSRRRFARHPQVELPPDPADPAQRTNAGTEQVVDLGAALGRLSRRQAKAVVLHYYLDLPVAEVAAVLGVAEGTVKSTLAAARLTMRRALGDGYR